MNRKILVLCVLVILLSGLAVRLVPASREKYPIGYDNFFHARMAELYSNGVPRTIPWPEERANLYPPSYHLLLAGASVFFGGDALQASRFLLPALSMLLPLTLLYVLAKIKGWREALVGFFLMTFNPFLITAGYNSPEVVGLALSLAAFYFLYKDRILLAGLAQAACFSFSFMAGVYSSVMLLLLLRGKRLKDAALFLAPSAVFLLAWYGSRYDLLYQSTNFFGSKYVFMSLRDWLFLYSPFILGAVIPVLFCSSYRSRFDRFWAVWSVFFLVAYFSFLVTPVLHPWRMPLYLSVGFVMLVSSALRGAKGQALKVLFIVSFTAACIVTVNTVAHSSLTPPDDALIQWISGQSGQRVMSEYSLCGHLLTLAPQKSCNLDLYFESIPDKQKWDDYERMFWEYSPELVRKNINEYSPDYIVYGSRDWGREILEDSVNVSKVFVSWKCDPLCGQEAAVYVPR